MIETIKYKILTAAILLLSICSVASASLSSDINAITSKSSFKNVKFAVKIVDASTRETIYTKNANEPMIPASNMKLLTSAGALHYLKADYKYKTKLAMLGSTLVVIGGGDPLLGDAQTDKKYDRKPGWLIDDMIQTLKDNSIKTVNNIIIDSTFFDNNLVHPSWPKDQLNQPYACQISGLNYNGNCVKITTKNSSGRITLSVTPNTKYVKLINKVKSTSKGNSAVGSYRTSTPNQLHVIGKCRKEAGFDVAIEKPASFFGILLAENLSQAGIKVTGQLTEQHIKNDPKIKILKTYSTPISDVMQRCNKDSFGLAAESLLKTISAEFSDGINGEWPHGLLQLSRYLTKLRVDTSKLKFDDASGLSRENRLTPAALTAVLLDVYKGDNWEMFKDTLAVSGVDGTIYKYFREPKYKGNIFGKTGYINGVRTFSGVASAGGKDYIFSIMTQGGGSSVRGAINDITEKIIDHAN